MRTVPPSAAMPASRRSESWHAFLSGLSSGQRSSIRDLLTVFHSLVVEDPLLNLVAVRVAQLNHCAPSLAAHLELAKRQEEHPMRLCHLSAWRDSSLFGPRERAALEWAEMVGTSLIQVDLNPVEDCVDTGLSSVDISTLAFVIAVVNLRSRLQLIATALGRPKFGMLRLTHPRPWYGTTDPCVR